MKISMRAAVMAGTLAMLPTGALAEPITLAAALDQAVGQADGVHGPGRGGGHRLDLDIVFLEQAVEDEAVAQRGRHELLDRVEPGAARAEQFGAAAVPVEQLVERQLSAFHGRDERFELGHRRLVGLGHRLVGSQRGSRSCGGG